jgi:Arc/MetJ-type ribon-helix-helix transcriptional regulator
MRKKISITLSPEVLAEIDRQVGTQRSRSAFIEGALREDFKEKVRQAINQRDLELINANADYLNRKALDVLRCQAPINYSSEE